MAARYGQRPGLLIGLALLLAGCGPASASPFSPGAPVPTATPAGETRIPDASAGMELPTTSLAPVAVIDSGLAVVGDGPGAFVTAAVADERLWLGGPQGLVRLDPDVNTVELIDTEPGGFLVAVSGDHALWRGSLPKNKLTRYQTPTGKATFSVDVEVPDGLLLAASRLWVTEHEAGQLIQLDPASGRELGRTEVSPPADCCGPGRVLMANGALWIPVPRDSAVVKVDPRTGSVVKAIHLEEHVDEVAGLASGAIWSDAVEYGDVPVRVPGTLYRIDAATDAVVDVVLPAAMLDAHGVVTEIQGRAWLAAGDEIVELDGLTGQPLRALRLTSGDVGFAPRLLEAFGSVWLFSLGDGRVLRLPLEAFAR